MISIVGFILSFISFSQVLAETLRSIEVEGSSPVEKSMMRGASSDFLVDLPGIHLRQNGGLADVPSMQGLSHDRVNIKIDGTLITNSCPNHMNPALSFVHPDQVTMIESYAGLDPVSNGGDQIAGSVLVRTKKMTFPQEGIDSYLRLRSFYKSNNFNSGIALSTQVAHPIYYFSYEGLQEKAGRYKDGKGRRLKGTIYQQNNQALVVGRKIKDGDVSLKASRSHIPYQGFVNQYMDLLDNKTEMLQLTLNQAWHKLRFELLSSFTHTDHTMDKLSSERPGKMPMDTRSDEFNTSLKFNYDTTLNFGLEFFQYRLEDWWDPVPGTMMGPRSFKSIHHGKRDRLGLFIENTFHQGERVEYLLGLRSDVVKMDAGEVSGYNDMMNAPVDAALFNSENRSKTDVHFDALLAVRYQQHHKKIEAGYARKTRSPNMYERYAWAGKRTVQNMDMRMINWFGDGNGYVGDIHLKPEVAHKFSVKYSYNDRKKLKWEFAPYVNYVEDFIDANVLRSSGNIPYLQFANEDALLYGFDFLSDIALFHSKEWGDFSLGTTASYTRGYRVDKKADLYHLMPLNMSLKLSHELSLWSSDLSLRMVSHKKRVHQLRKEAQTAGYALLDVSTRFKWSKFTWELGVSNILNKDYQMPLAGVDLVNVLPSSKTAQWGMGRSFNTQLIMDF